MKTRKTLELLEQQLEASKSEARQDRMQYFTSYPEFNNNKCNSPRINSETFDGLNTNLNNILNDKKDNSDKIFSELENSQNISFNQ